MDIATTHKNTDFDALASVVAATILYPGTTAVVPRAVNPNVKAFLSIHKDMFSVSAPDDIDTNAVDTMVVVDTNRWERLDGMGALRERTDLHLRLWDHHDLPGNIDADEACQETMGANITLMVRALARERKVLTPIQATLFLAGIYEDTGNLSFPSTQPEDARAAAFLLERRADLNILKTFLRPAYGVRQKEMLFQMLQGAERQRINGHSVSISQQEITGHVDSLAVVVRMFREIMNVGAAFGIFNNAEKKRCMVIGRSENESLDIGSIMRGLGGGGHPGAGSAMLKKANPEVVREMIVSLIEGNQQASVQISDLMSFPVFSVPADMPMRQAAMVLREKGCTGVPVTQDNDMVGILSRRDFQRTKNESHLNSPVKAFMSTDVLTIEPGMSPMQAANTMVKHDVGRLPVVENGKLIGILTRSDVMMYFYDLLPD
ncbi:MAG: CBS domain-containing protein [Desulfobacterales bacterium]|nr:CBS domain-containing protein [Desulfobacterales bacterium]